MSHIHLALESIPSGVFFAATNVFRQESLDALDSRGVGARPYFSDNNTALSAKIGRQFPIFRKNKLLQHAGYPPAPASPTPDALNDTILCLPLLDVTVDVRVEGTISRTTLTQRFTNLDPTTHIPEAHYTFPLYDGAAITSFRCYIGDSRLLAGVVKPKEVAKQVYRRAIEKMETAALLEEHTPEVLETLLGNIPPSTSVKIELTYVSELKIDQGEKGGVLVTVPTSVAPRYGAPPDGYKHHGSSGVNEAGLNIVVTATSPGPIQKIECRTHPVSVEMGILEKPETIVAPTFATLVDQGTRNVNGKAAYTATARLTNPHATMDRDFVLHVLASPGLSTSDGRVHSRAMLSPVNGDGHAALMVSLRPCELFERFTTTSFDGEIVFLADRSGSMDGKKIQALREALVVFLKSLPLGCTFNIVSFGSHFKPLWNSSRAYSQEAVDDAVKAVESFAADMGGTELLPGLTEVVKMRNVSEGSSSTQVMVLTDGEVWGTEQTINFVREQRRGLGDKIRFFALGIGNQVSHRLIQGIGSEGGGFGEVCGVDGQGVWKERVIAMLKAALSPSSWACKFELGDEYIAKTLTTDSFFDHGTGLAVQTPAPSYICAPHSCPPIHHYAQKSIFFLLMPGTSPAPAKITIRATGCGVEESVAVIDVEETIQDAQTIQHLAARAALLDLEGESHSAEQLDIVCDNAERIGTKYSIASKWTSFVAVDVSTNDLKEINSYKASVSSSATQKDDLSWLTMPITNMSAATNIATPEGPVTTADVDFNHANLPDLDLYGAGIGLSTMLPSYFQTYQSRNLDFAALSFAPVARDMTADWSDEDVVPDLTRSGCSESPTSFTRGMHARERERRPEPTYRGIVSRVRRKSEIAAKRRSRPKSSSIPAWSEILAAQSADGHFALTPLLLQSLSCHFCPGTRDKLLSSVPAEKMGDAEKLATALETAMVIIYITTHFTQRQRLWGLMVEKAKSQAETRLRELGLWDRLEKSMQCAHLAAIKTLSTDVGCKVCDGQVKPVSGAVVDQEANAVLQCHQCDEVNCTMTWEELWDHQVDKGHLRCPPLVKTPEGDHRETFEAAVGGKEKKARFDDTAVEGGQEGQGLKEQEGASSAMKLEIDRPEGTGIEDSESISFDI